MNTCSLLYWEFILGGVSVIEKRPFIITFIGDGCVLGAFLFNIIIVSEIFRTILNLFSVIS